LKISQATFYAWKKKYAGLGVSELRRLKHEIASVRVRYGFWRIYVLIRRDGWQVNHSVFTGCTRRRD